MGKVSLGTCLWCTAVPYCCGAVVLCTTAALLGRFLPRLGPLVFTSGPFFLSPCRSAPPAVSARLLRGGLERSEIGQRDGRAGVGKSGDVGGDPRKIRAALAAALVHVDCAIELDLDRMQRAAGIAVMLGDEAARIGLVAADRVAKALHRVLDHVGQQRRAARAIAVADHEIGPARFLARDA